MAEFTRRTLLKGAAALGAAAMLGGCAPQTFEEDELSQTGGEEGPEPVIEVKHAWCKMCGPARTHCSTLCTIKDGRWVHVEGNPEAGNNFGRGSKTLCAKGNAAMHTVYAPNRLLYPMKRVGKRGEGKFEQISWDEAYQTIADKLKSVIDTYGNEAVYVNYASGVSSSTSRLFPRLANLMGGYLGSYNDYSTNMMCAGMPFLYGDTCSPYDNVSASSISEAQNADLIIMFGNSPAETRMGGANIAWDFAQVREKGGKIYHVDYRMNETVSGHPDEWLPIRTGTDAALVAGMIQYLFAEGKLDEDFLRSKFVGFFSDSFAEDVAAAEPASTAFMGLDASGSLTVEEDMSYEAYLAGTGAYAGTGEKTPEWAAAITGIPAAVIRELADLYVDGPTATIQGWGPQRHSNGGNSSRAIAMIAAITGNVGISGGGTGAREGVGGVPYATPTAIPCFPEKNTVDVCVSFFDWYQAIEDYTVMNDATWGIRHIDETGATSYAEEPGTIALKAPIKFIWNYGSNVMMGQHADINDSLRIYNLPDEKDSGVRMIVTVDPWMTPTAMASDIILPGTTPFEEDDLTAGGTAWTGFLCCESAAIEPLFEAKPVDEICTLIADKLGLKDEFTEGKSQLDWIEWCYEQGKEAGDDLPATFEEFRAGGLFKQPDDHEPAVAPLPEALATPSGKYEVFSKQAYNLSKQWDLTGGGVIPDDGRDQITALPIWYDHFEGFGDPLRQEYPFQLIGHHTKTRTHSSYGNVPWMSSVAPQQCWINDGDAATLGIAQDDAVIVSTERGRSQMTAKVTNRIMPGVVSVPQGAWYDPETRDGATIGDRGVLDRGGCISVLTSSRPTPISKGNGVHSNLCKIEKA